MSTKPTPTLSLVGEVLSVSRYVPKSDVFKVADAMPAALRAELAEAIANRDVSPRRLSEVLGRRGYKLGASSIQHFRNQGYSL